LFFVIQLSPPPCPPPSLPLGRAREALVGRRLQASFLKYHVRDILQRQAGGKWLDVANAKLPLPVLLELVSLCFAVCVGVQVGGCARTSRHKTRAEPGAAAQTVPPPLRPPPSRLLRRARTSSKMSTATLCSSTWRRPACTPAAAMSCALMGT
jgi:hypothetical protein